MTDLLRVEDLHIAFDLQGVAHNVVKGVSFRVRPGSVVALVGESGSGKSVIAQAIMGILPGPGTITGGKIVFSDPAKAGEPLDIAALPQDSKLMQLLRGGRISMIFQEPMTSLSPLHTVGNQVQEALLLHHKDAGRDARRQTEDMLALVGFPDPARAFDMYSFELSGGLRQRAMIAMALICRPALLIADEPTTALDVTVQAQIIALLKDLQQKLGMAILLITHDLGVVANMADEVVVIYHGRVMEAGIVQDIFGKPQHPYLQALLKAVPHFDMKPGERLVSLRDVKAEQGAVARKSERIAPDPGRPVRGGVLMQVKGMVKSFETRKTSFLRGHRANAVRAVDNVSFTIRRGECLGLVGESGCGKTTVSKVIMRALTPDAGQVTFLEEGSETDVLALEGDALTQFRRRIQMIFQDPFSSLSPRMTVLNILREPMIIHSIGSRQQQIDRVIELMRCVGLDPRFLSRYPHSFSGGQRQRIGIARALALSPDLLICDEPVSALDVSVQAQILNLLKDLQAELGLTYLFISHNLAVVDYVADRIAVMCRGRIVELAPREVLFREPAHPYTRALLKAVPYPDLARPLDLADLARTGASDEGHWAKCYCGEELSFIELDDGHFVLANANAERRELVA